MMLITSLLFQLRPLHTQLSSLKSEIERLKTQSSEIPGLQLKVQTLTAEVEALRSIQAAKTSALELDLGRLREDLTKKSQVQGSSTTSGKVTPSKYGSLAKPTGWRYVVSVASVDMSILTFYASVVLLQSWWQRQTPMTGYPAHMRLGLKLPRGPRLATWPHPIQDLLLLSLANVAAARMPVISLVSSKKATKTSSRKLSLRNGSFDQTRNEPSWTTM